MIKPIVGTIAGIKFFPGEDTNSCHKKKLTLGRPWDNVWTKPTIYGLVTYLSLVNLPYSMLCNSGHRCPSPSRVAQVCRLIRGENSLGVPDLGAFIFADRKIRGRPSFLFTIGVVERKVQYNSVLENKPSPWKGRRVGAIPMFGP